METVLVTGAAGTVGNYVVGLAEAQGYRVIANDVQSLALRQPTRGEIRAGDLTDADVRRHALEGVDHVIHTAGLVDATADATALGRVNTRLVEQLYEDASTAGVKRFVHLSTCMLYAPNQRQPLTEDSEIAPRGPHGLSKQGAESFLRGRGRGDGPAWTILRAAPLYGRRGRHFAAALLAIGPIMKMGLPVLPRMSGGPRANLVHAYDVASALLFSIGDERTAYGVYNVADNDVLPLGDRITQTFDAYELRTMGSGVLPSWLTDVTARTFQAPGAFRAADTSVLSMWQAVVMRHGLKPALRPRLDREAVTLLDEHLQVDSSRLRALGWEPRHDTFREGWGGVLRWYQAERWVPRY